MQKVWKIVLGLLFMVSLAETMMVLPQKKRSNFKNISPQTLYNKVVKTKVDPAVTPTPKQLGASTADFVVVNRYIRNELAFTEGLSYYKGMLLESTGSSGETRLQWIKLNDQSKTVEVLKKLPFPDEYFGEGSSVVNINGVPTIFMMTYLQRIAVKVDEGLNSVQKVFDMPSQIREGWGMTLYPTKENTVLVSDGSNNIYECDASQNLKITNTRSIMDPVYEIPLSQINELEYVDGYLWANRFLLNEIVKIDLSNNRVVKTVDLESLRQEATKTMAQKFGRYLSFDEVLNGIAYNPEKDTFYLTGKRWPVIFEVRLSA